MSILERQQLIRGTTSSAPSTLRAATIMVNSSACALWKSRSLYTVYAYDPVAWLARPSVIASTKPRASHARPPLTGFRAPLAVFELARARSHAGLSGIQKAATESSETAGSAPSANATRQCNSPLALESRTPAATAGAKPARMGRPAGPTVSWM
jgi:hypothetical protein